jgi:hypothetical protein
MRVLVLFCLIGVLAAPVAADWNVGDPHKMHFPQLPDPTGWDVNTTRDFMYDDWRCSGTGPVSDIHFWGSWKGDNQGQFAGIIVKIFADVPAGPDPPYFSHPTWPDPLWSRNFYPQDWTMRGPYTGDQGWFDPQPPVAVNPHDHDYYYQINFENIWEPFLQEQDTIYWLAIHTIPTMVGPEFGWKTSQDHWNDDAVFYYSGGWHELRDPYTYESLDLAFVITPEPAALALLTLAVVALRRR